MHIAILFCTGLAVLTGRLLIE